MQPTKLLRVTIALGLLLVFLACDRQAETDYKGESLLQIRGSLSVPKAFEGLDLVPAVEFFVAGPVPKVWPSRYVYMSGDFFEYGFTEIIDVDVKGEFPSNFTVNLFDPPPAGAILENGPSPLDPAYAQGVIAVVSSSHPDKISRKTLPCEDGPAGEVCKKLYTCPFDENLSDNVGSDTDPEDEGLDKCYEQTTNCFDDHDPFSCEVVETGGDKSMAAAGYSKEIVVVYFSAPVLEATWLANTYNNGDAISAGYHLYLRKPDSFRACEQEQRLAGATAEAVNQECGDLRDVSIPDCYEQAKATALDRYNKEQGSDYTIDELYSHFTEVGDIWVGYQKTVMEVTKESDCSYDDSKCFERAESVALDRYNEESETNYTQDELESIPNEEWAFDRTVHEIQKEIDCSFNKDGSLDDYEYTQIDDPAKATVSIELGEVNPLDEI